MNAAPTWLMFFAVGITLCHQPTVFGEDPPGIDVIIESLEQREQRFFDVDSLLLRYERSECQDVLKSKASGGHLPAEWTLAFRGRKWFMERRFTKPGAADGIRVPEEPKTQLFKDHVLLEWRQDAKSAFLNEFETGGNIYAGLFYTDFLGFDVAKYVAASGEVDVEKVRKENRGYEDHPFLPSFLKENARQYRIHPEREEVDGRLCWVVEWEGMDRLSLDPELGYAVRHREYHWGAGKPKRLEIAFRDYREVKPDLWLPFQQEIQNFASVVAEEQALWGKVTAKSLFTLNAAEFDSLDDSFFSVQLPVGTRVIDVPRGVKYTVTTSDKNPFDREIQEAVRVLGEKKPTSRKWPILLIANLCLLAFVVALFVYRKIRRA